MKALPNASIWVGVLLAVLPVSASAQDEGNDEGQGPGNQQSETDTESEFVTAYLHSEIQFDPLESFTSTEAQIYTALYEGLVNYHPLTLDPVPGVAERWESSPDGLTYRFYLRQDARYSNGDAVLAEHFRDTWLELLDPRNDSAYSFLFDIIEGAEEYRTGEETDPDTVGIYVESAAVLRVELEHPATHFVDILCHHSFSALHPDMRAADDVEDLPELITNGPYRMDRHDDEEIVLEENEYYWDRRNVSIPRLRFVFGDDPGDITEAFNDEEIDWVAGGMDLERVKYEDTIQVNPLFATTYFFLNTGRPGLENPRVRRALLRLLPLEQMRSEDLHFIPADTLVPSIPLYPEVEGIREQRIDDALETLAEEGHPAGENLGPIVVRMPRGAEADPVTTLMVESWREHLDVDVELETRAYDSYFDSLSDDEYTVGQISWIGDFADPLTFLQMWTSRSNLNDSGFADEEFDELLRTSMSQTGNRRFQTLAESEQRLLDSAVVLPVSHTPAINLIDLNRVEGWYSNSLDIHPYKYLELAGRRPLPGTAGDLHRRLPVGFTARP
ncbi:MAG: peptide ABC transporter substrate-binding protein [Spirochaetaceae bacterium]